LVTVVVSQQVEKTPWFQWIEKHEEAGTLNGILGELGSTVLSVMKIIGFQNTGCCG
jgi:haloalkane dehalogenase